MPQTQRGQLKALIVLLGPAWIPIFLDAEAVSRAAELFPLSLSQQPYFIPDHAWLLYIWAPVVVASGNILLMSPGLCLALTFKPLATRASGWLVSGMLLSLVTVSAAVESAEAMLGMPIDGISFAALIAGTSLGAWGLAYRRAGSNHGAPWPLEQGGNVAVIGLSLLGPFILLVALAPKFYWESFNGDGAHSYEASRLLLDQAIPFFPKEAGAISGFPGLTSMLFAYPGAWFLRLYGNHEVAARLPFLLYLPAMYCALVTVIEAGRSARVGVAQGTLLWLALGIYTVALAFSATYNPYSADLALPATQDTLLMFCFLAFVAAFVLGSGAFWLLLATVLTYVSLPNGTMLMGLWLVAVVIAWRPLPMGRLILVGLTLAVCLASGAVLPKILGFFGFPYPGGEYAASGLLKRFELVQWQHVQRLAYFVLPAGILPALALLAWPAQDRVARAITLVCCAYLAVFYFQAHISLHHFVPLMVLPLIVFWRIDALVSKRRRPLTYVVTALAGIVALELSLPTTSAPFIDAALVGSQIEDRVGGYEQHDPLAFRRAELLSDLFPPGHDMDVPAKAFGGSPLVWNWYAQHPATKNGNVNYVLQMATEPPPFGLPPLVTENGWALYVKDWERYQTHLKLRPPSPAGSPVYEVPRGILFRGMPMDENISIVNLRALARALKARALGGE